LQIGIAEISDGFTYEVITYQRFTDSWQSCIKTSIKKCRNLRFIKINYKSFEIDKIIRYNYVIMKYSLCTENLYRNGGIYG